jgi:ubiquinone/menaquinone biosynthesis C-methylase UbiE
MADQYHQGLSQDKEKSKEYFKKSVVKTEQQKFLEKLLAGKASGAPLSIADIACGGGTLTYHLRQVFDGSTFTMVDFFEDALQLARDLNGNDHCTYQREDIYELSSRLKENYDLVFCWQTLSWLDEPKKALAQLIDITKPGGSIYISSLFNIDHDVDIFSKVYDRTRESGQQGIAYNYNTYSEKSVREWIGSSAKSVTLHRFIPGMDFSYDGRGLGTFTINTQDRGRLQVSGGLLMNWAIVEIHK